MKYILASFVLWLTGNLFIGMYNATQIQGSFGWFLVIGSLVLYTASVGCVLFHLMVRNLR